VIKMSDKSKLIQMVESASWPQMRLGSSLLFINLR
jgi:hypothetical protein